MTHVADVEAVEEGDDPRVGTDAEREGVVAQLRWNREALEKNEQEHRRLMDRRLELFQEGRSMTPKITMSALAQAAGVSDVAVTLALRPACEGSGQPATTRRVKGKARCPSCGQQVKVKANGETTAHRLPITHGTG